MQRRSVLAVLTLFCWAAPLYCQQQNAGVDEAVARFMAQGKVPGLTVAVAAGGQFLWSRGYGLADVENSVPAKPSTVYRLASISKPITAVAALQLVEKSLLDLDAPVQKYLPKFPVKPWPITARQLLAHLGGIRHYSTPEEMSSTQNYQDLAGPLRIFQDDPLLTEPGLAFHYTTYGYVLAGAVVEAAAGQRFADFLRDHVFKPAGLEHIQLDNLYAIIPHRSRGYRLTSGGQLENCAPADTSNKIPGGGLSSTAEDLVKFALALKNGKLLKPETFKMMQEPQKLKNGKATDYGLGWSLFQEPRLIGHSGGQQGVSTMLLMNPVRGDVVAVMANLQEAHAEELAVAILRIVAP